jgi:CspA family cold shock protein
VKETGEVIFFNRDKGWGFIKRDRGGQDLFCHYSGIAGDGFRNLNQGDKVEFEVVEGTKGPQAAEVKTI